MMTPEEAAALREKFKPSQIGKLPKGGTQLDYVGHAATTDRLLQVDPNWTWEPFAVDEMGLPAMDPARNLWIKLTVCGVTRIGVGDGASVKERIGDAIRNAAMRFGVALDLWAKEDLDGTGTPTPAPRAARETPSAPQPDARTVRRSKLPRNVSAALHAALRDAGKGDREHGLAYIRQVVQHDVNSTDDLTQAEVSKVITAANELRAKPAEPDADEQQMILNAERDEAGQS